MRRFTDEQIQLITEMIDWYEVARCSGMYAEFKINSDMSLMFSRFPASCKVEFWEWDEENEEWNNDHRILIAFTGDFEDDMIGGVWKLLESIEED